MKKNVNVKQYLAIAIEVIRENGYVSTKESAEKQIASTKGIVDGLYVLHVERKGSSMYADVYQKNEADAHAIISWWLGQNKEYDNFWFSVAEILRKGEMSTRATGFVAFLPDAYAKSQAYVAKQKSLYADAYIDASVKDKVSVNVVLKARRYYETVFGTNAVYTFVDSANRRIVWSTSPKDSLDEIDIYAKKSFVLRGTVKGLNDGKYGKESVLTRCKVIA